MGYAFISYSSKNQSEANAMKKLLNDEGIETWMAPGDIPAGSSYMKEINHALKNCSCLILLLSEAAQISQWVVKEVERALNYKKPIIPVQIELVVLNDEFEFAISSFQVVAIQKIDKDSEDIKKVIASAHAYTETNRIEKKSLPRPDETMYCLEAVNDKEIKYNLNGGANLIGKDQRKATILIDGDYISRIHAVITVFEQKCLIRDLNAANGTYLNGRRLGADKGIRLADGDILRFANKEFVFHEYNHIVNEKKKFHKVPIEKQTNQND